VIAPAPSKLVVPSLPPLTMKTKATGWKRKLSSRIVDENFVGAESNPVTKHLKLSANAAWAGSVKCYPRQPSVEDAEDEGGTSENISPNALLEATNGSDDVEMLDKDPALALKDFEEDDEDGQEVPTPVETAEAEHSESTKMW